MSFFSSSLFHDFQMDAHRAIALWVFWVLQVLFLLARTSGEQSPLPHDHGALGQSFLKPALPVLSVLPEIDHGLKRLGTFLCTSLHSSRD